MSRTSQTGVVEAALAGELETTPPEGVNALVLAPPAADPDEIAGRLLAALDPAKLLGIGLNAGDARFARLCRDHLDDPPVEIGVVDVGGDGSAIEIPDGRVLGVAEPSDLTGLGVAMTKFLRVLDGGAPTVVYVDDLTPLLEFVELDRCLRFLDVTVDRLERSAAISASAVNPLAHDESVVDQLEAVYDVVVEFDEAGWHVRRP